jgi:hypothetical protein
MTKREAASRKATAADARELPLAERSTQGPAG